MKCLWSGIGLFVGLSIGLGQEGDALPPVSKEIVDKLNSWEAEKREALEAEIRTKREEVIAILRKHMSEVTSSGNLDGALAVKKEIAEQEKKAAKPEARATKAREPFAEWIRSVELHEVDTWWKISGRRDFATSQRQPRHAAFACKIDEVKRRGILRRQWPNLYPAISSPIAAGESDPVPTTGRPGCSW